MILPDPKPVDDPPMGRIALHNRAIDSGRRQKALAS